jgi:hypothetical protein
MNLMGRIRGLINGLLMDRMEGENGRRTTVISRRKPVFSYQEEVPLEAYRRMRNDPQVQAEISVIKLPILAQTFSIDGPGDIVETITKAISASYNRIISRALLAIEFGFSVQEIIWAENDNLFTISGSMDFDPVSVKLNINEYGDVISYTIPGGIEVPGEKAFVFTYRKEFGNPYGTSRLLSAYDVWRTKELIWLFTNRYFERKGNPPTVVKYPATPNQKESDRNADDALEMGRALLENAVVALPSTRDETGKEIWELGYLTDDARAGMFLDYLTYLDRMILRAMFIPDRVMTQEDSAGSYALARAHLDLFLISEDGLISELEEEMNRQVVDKIIEYNYGRRMPDVRLRISRLSRVDRELMASVFMEMVRSGDARLPAETLAKELGFPTIEK